MKKYAVLPFIIILSCILGGTYGILHDFLTYSISPEYYTEFKFVQFGLHQHYENAELYITHPFVPVAIVGWMATWWMGLIIGTILGLVALRLPDYKSMLKTTLKAFGITIVIAFTTGLIGLAYGYLFLQDKEQQLRQQGWMIPEELKEPNRFIMVGSMHNFSYLGGVLGMIAGIYIIWRKRRMQIEI